MNKELREWISARSVIESIEIERVWNVHGQKDDGSYKYIVGRNTASKIMNELARQGYKVSRPMPDHQSDVASNTTDQR